MTARSFQLSRIIAAGVCLFGLIHGDDALGGTPPCALSPNGVPCAPARVTFGYYPTSWRRWPTDTPNKSPKTQADRLPTPAKESLPVEEPAEAPPGEEAPPAEIPKEPAAQEMPSDAPFGAAVRGCASRAAQGLDARSGDHGSAFGTEGIVAVRRTADAARRQQSFLDSAWHARPPGRRSLQGRNARKQRAPAAEPPKKGTSVVPAPADRPATVQWCAMPKPSAAPDEVPQTRLVPVVDEPRLLRLADTSEESGPALLPVQSHNPLRSAAIKPRVKTVVPTASWSSESSAARNPLR